MKDEGTKTFFMLILTILLVIFLPMIAILCINTLFDSGLDGHFLSKHWTAMFFLMLIIKILTSNSSDD